MTNSAIRPGSLTTAIKTGNLKTANTASASSADSRPNSAIKAENLHLSSKRGLVYGPLDWSLEQGHLGIVTGPPDSGKSTLMLTLAGRMRPSRGSTLEVLGHDLPADENWVQHHTSATGVSGLDDLDDVVTVRSTVRERLAWLSPWYKFVRYPDDQQIAEICRPAFGDLPVPTAKTRVYKLDEPANLLLRIALALASNPGLITVDAIDQLHDLSDQVMLLSRLDAIAASGVTVVVSSTSTQALDGIDWTTPPSHLDLTTTAAAKEA
jgi:ABC-type multidrug transport system ATPase subunit